MIEVIFFDASGTLFHLPRGVGAHYREVAARFGCRLDRDALDRAFGSVWKAMPPRAASRAARADDDKEWWRELVGRVLDRCSGAAGGLDRDAYFDALYDEFTKPGVWELYPEVAEVLAKLRPQYRLAIISNFDGRLRPILENFGLTSFFDLVVISSEVGADKPHRWIFEQALARAGIEGREALHVGDDPVCDWQGATDAGMHVFQLDRPANSLRDLPARIKALSAS